MIRRLAALAALCGGAAFASNPDGGCTITTAAVLPQAVRDSSYSATIATTGCTSPMRTVLEATSSLPPGLYLKVTTSGAQILGKPTQSGTFAFGLRAIDYAFKIPSKSFVLQVNAPLQIDTPALSTSANNVAYTDVIRVRGGVAPYTFSLAQGVLPSGITLNASTGALSGTFTAPGYAFRVRVTDSASPANVTEKSLEIVYSVTPPNSTQPPSGNVGTPYSFALEPVCCTTGYTIALGALPPGLSISTGGTISGTPTLAGEYHFTALYTNTHWRSYRILISNAISVSGTPRDAEETAAYDNVLTASGGVFPYTYAVTAGSLPNGITLDSSTGALLGELALGSGGTSFTITATDATGRTGAQPFTINRAFKLSGSTTTPPTAKIQTTTGPVTPYTLTQGGGTKFFTKVGGPGDQLIYINSSTGQATYTLNSPGTYTPVILGSDTLGGGVILSTTYTGVDYLKFDTATELPNGLQAVPYSAAPVVKNGVFTPLTFAIAGGMLPPGLGIDTATGQITGTPEGGSPGVGFAFEISVTDNIGQTDSRDYFIGIGNGMRITTTSLPGGTMGSTYSATLSQTGATGPIWTPVMASALPPGLSLSSAGVLSGTPTATGGYTFDVQLTHTATSDSDIKRFLVWISNPFSATVAPATTLNTSVGLPIGALVTTSGGRAPYTLSISSGTLPEGVTTLNVSGLGLQGTTLLTGTSNFTMLITDADGRTASIPYTIAIRDYISVSNSNSLPPASVGVPYSVTLTATGGGGTYTFAPDAGNPPPGITLSSSGVLSGTPTLATTASFAIFVTDQYNQGGEIPLLITVAPALSITTPSPLPNATYSTAYSFPIATSGGDNGRTFSISSGNVQSLIDINPETGVLSGIPLTGGTYNFTVRVKDIGGRIATKNLQLSVTQPAVVAPSVLPNGNVNIPYSQTFTNTAPVGTVTWSVLSGTLPPGLTLNSATGVLSGTPTTANTYSFVIQSADDQLGPADPTTMAPTSTARRFATRNPSVPAYITQSYTVTIFNQATITPSTLPNGLVNTIYSQALTATPPSNSAATWSIFSGSPPPGITINPTTGALGGTPTSTGVYPFTVQALYGSGQLGRQAYSLTILGGLTVSPSSIPNPTLGLSYSQALTVSGATGAVTWTLATGTIPPGLAVGPTTGVISGIPTMSGTYTFTVRATDSLTQTGQQTYSVTVSEPFLITTASLPDGTETESYSAALTSNSSNPGSVTWAITAGTLPPGLTLNAATGAITGTTTKHGVYPVTVEASMPSGITGSTQLPPIKATKAFSITVYEVLTIFTGSLGEAVQGKSYVTVLVASGGRAPYTWSLVGSSLPSGLTLNPSTGQITGSTSVADGSYPQTLNVRDSRNRTAQKVVPLTVSVPPPPSLTIGPDSLPNGRVNQPYSAGFSASGGTPGYSFSVAGGSLPPGLTFSGSTLSGTPTTDGTFRFTINATDSTGRVAGNSYAVVIEPALLPLTVTPTTIAAATTLGQPYTQQFGATGGKAPYTFVISGSTPPGTSSNSSGLLSGTPSAGGAYTFTVEVTDALSQKASRTYTVTVTGNLMITTTPPLAEGTVGKPYSVVFGAAGGKPPYSWSISGTTPAGLSLDSGTGTLSGTPAAAGPFPITVEVRDSQRLSATASFTITIYEKLEITNAPADTPLVTGQPFNFGFTVKGGKPPVTLSVVSGSLPGGLSMSGAGAISGSPTTAGTFPFTVQATDALGNLDSRAATLRVVAPLTVTTDSLPTATVGTSYSSSVGATGGIPPLGSWSISAGSLPAGLSFGSDGSISGTPTAAGTSSFTVRITDSVGTVATRALSITVSQPAVPPITISGLPQTLPPGTQTNITIQIASPVTVPVTGTLTLIFEPNAVNNADDPTVQFSSGGRTVTFQIPAGQTAGSFPVNPLRLLSGTVAGNIRIRTTTEPPSATPVPDAVVPIARSAPVITGGTAQLGSGSFTLVIDGFSNTREISAATFRLTPTAGSSLQTTDVPVSVAAAYTAWYQSSASAPFGGQFRLTLPFNVSGSLNDIDSVTVTVTNSVGTSQPFIVRLR